MEIDQLQEKFDTGLKKIRYEIKSCLVLHGLFGTVSHSASSELPDGTRVEIHANGNTVGKSLGRAQIEGCCLRVGAEVQSAIISMVDELASSSKSTSTQ